MIYDSHNKHILKKVTARRMTRASEPDRRRRFAVKRFRDLVLASENRKIWFFVTTYVDPLLPRGTLPFDSNDT